MKSVYEASNTLEAHMLIDVLKQQGLSARIHGEHLQGAVGELPAGALVRVVVEDEDFDAARKVVLAWEGEQPSLTPTTSPQTNRSRRIQWFAVGLALGATLTYAAFRAPAQRDGTDHNRDGVLDERWTYSPTGRPIKAEVDRNLDGKIDYVSHYDARGLIETAESDDDFDGVFESRQSFLNGNNVLSESDSDGDGFPDIRWRYTNGVLATTEYLNPASGRPLRVEHYKLGRLLSADIDKDKDGRLDTRLNYNAAIDVVSTTAILQ